MFLLGPKSDQSILISSVQLEHLAIAAYNLRHETATSQYHPWMSNSKAHQPVAPIVLDDLRLNIISNPYHLDVLHHLFKTDECNLGQIRPDPCHLRVMPKDSEKLGVFSKLFSETITLTENCRRQTLLLKGLIKHIVPMESNTPESPYRIHGSGISSHRYRGGILLSLPDASPVRIMEAGLNLSHELGHQALMVYQCADPIISGDLYKESYSVVRRTKRPAILSFHALVATAFMSEWLLDCFDSVASLCGRANVTERLCGLESDMLTGIAMLSNLEYTPLGRAIFDEIRAQDSKLRYSVGQKGIANARFEIA